MIDAFRRNAAKEESKIFMKYQKFSKFSDKYLRSVWANTAEPDQTAHRGTV